MKSSLSLLFVTSLLFISCKKELEPQDSTVPSKAVPFTESANSQQNQSVTPAQTTQNSNTPESTPAAVTKGMNPAHGQPGHRCDISVGAPLNSPIATPKNNPVVPQQNNPVSTTTVTPNPITTPTPEGMNPPHGQEKHRCDIAVGAPLPKE
jgi:hypothetical protein